MINSDFYDFRQQLLHALIADIIGPSSRDEVLDEYPLTRYAAGVLYARKSGEWTPDQDADEGDENESGFADRPVALSKVRYPSSMGLTFAVEGTKSPVVRVQLRAARYVCLEESAGKVNLDENGEPLVSPEEERELDSQIAEALRRRRTRPKTKWKREEIALEPIELRVDEPFSGDVAALDRATGLRLFARVRRPDENGIVPITLVLSNQQDVPHRELGDAHAFFQSEIEVTAPDGASPFVERPSQGRGADDDLRSYRLLYRHARSFAVGHGCSVAWDSDARDEARAARVATVWAPVHELLLADSNQAIQSPALGMKWLGENNARDAATELLIFCDSYGDWIEGLRARVPSLALDADQTSAATEHLAACRDALERMKRGVARLRTDKLAWRAFALSNRAMATQRARTVWIKAGKPASGPVEDGTANWRPFQLAFILLCLEGIANPQSQERDWADLLWFPTGGGKTEAYLGLIAFTTFLRRLRAHQSGASGAGVTALMRYTLRLLTLQQFERATLLICAMEILRRGETDLGSEPISIGLWLGQAATPNNLNDARDALNKLRQGRDAELSQTGNPVQILACPWCGHKMDHSNYFISPGRAGGARQLIASCRQAGCAFEKQLPVHVVDEDVYNHRPTLLIATVDKFASLPWRGEEVSQIFGFKTSKSEAVPPPELIVQDELHLISGPLGTLVGLYETAIDLLCEHGGARPKVIASTATIRRAKEQGKALFNRPVRQFPPPGLDARDSYFAVETSREQKASRLYVGLFATGMSNPNAMNRVYASLLQSGEEIPATQEVKNPYWTLVGYFNSLRVLGASLLQTMDAVPDFMGAVARRNGTKARIVPEDSRLELTSRVPSGSIRQRLDQMAVDYPNKRALSLILATNMIAVGVDIDRLGLMVVMNQPGTTSEYIQASSRVGRKFPGLVVTLFNPARSRDRSHYEAFPSYHGALYRQVEATSVTPFSARARDRGLHAVLIALARQLVKPLRENARAEDIALHRGDLEPVIERIVERVLQVTGRVEEADATRVHLHEIIGKWQCRADASQLKYFAPSPDDALMFDASQLQRVENAFPTLWSLRDVDPESNLGLWSFGKVEKARSASGDE